MPSLVPFDLRTLHQLGDGTLADDFAATLQGLVKDCLARPGIEKKRQVSIVIDVLPHANQDGTCDDVEIRVQVASKAPARQVTPYVMRATVQGQLRYAPDSPGNPDQGTLDYDAGEEA